MDDVSQKRRLREGCGAGASLGAAASPRGADGARPPGGGAAPPCPRPLFPSRPSVPFPLLPVLPSLPRLRFPSLCSPSPLPFPAFCSLPSAPRPCTSAPVARSRLYPDKPWSRHPRLAPGLETLEVAGKDSADLVSAQQ